MAGFILGLAKSETFPVLVRAATGDNVSKSACRES
jgi:hypothetical protein